MASKKWLRGQERFAWRKMGVLSKKNGVHEYEGLSCGRVDRPFCSLGGRRGELGEIHRETSFAEHASEGQSPLWPCAPCPGQWQQVVKIPVMGHRQGPMPGRLVKKTAQSSSSHFVRFSCCCSAFEQTGGLSLGGFSSNFLRLTKSCASFLHGSPKHVGNSSVIAGLRVSFP